MGESMYLAFLLATLVFVIWKREIVKTPFHLQLALMVFLIAGGVQALFTFLNAILTDMESAENMRKWGGVLVTIASAVCTVFLLLSLWGRPQPRQPV